MITIAKIEELLPPALLALYRGGQHYSSVMVPIGNRFADWFKNSDIPFFRFYTDHSVQHCLDVFRTAIELMAEEAYRPLSIQDLSILFAASFCHDAGMHLTETQFVKLISLDNANVFSFIDSKSWPELWELFIEDAKRFNERTLTSIFGDTRPIEIPPNDVTDFTERHKMLIGEFLRRHHARLAHDLALGLDQKLGLGTLLAEFSTVERNIVGLISRSHGMDVRDCFPIIENHFHLQDYNRIHLVYIMILIRLADYMQIQADRISITKSHIHKIQSPLSQREWRVHSSIKNITRAHLDPESIFIDTLPESVHDYLRVNQWLTDLQAEVDKSWAILGEVYGRFSESGANKLTLSLRRIRSTLSEKKRSFTYLPEEIRFRVAESEMLLLLLGPLYGNHAGYGIRELIQNAHDSLREAVYLGAAHLSNERPTLTVKFTVKDKDCVFEIVDNGIGMTADIVKNYFLTAGASFRSSEEWRKNFSDSQGKAKIIRSGRFGVGVLAAFIIGDEITVMTRHYLSNEEDGLLFKTTLSQSEIEVRRCGCVPGTKISVKVEFRQKENIVRWITNARRYFSIEPFADCNITLNDNGKETTASMNSSQDSSPTYTFSTFMYGRIRFQHLCMKEWKCLFGFAEIVKT